MRPRIRRACGFTLVSTLFLLVVVAGLAGYLVNLSVAQHSSGALALNTLRGRYAALGGLEWVSYRIANVDADCPPVPSSLAIDGFTVTLSGCTTTDVTEGSDTYRLHDVVVRAERGAFGDADFVSLAVRATLGG